jgi:hypothetical protein
MADTDTPGAIFYLLFPVIKRATPSAAHAIVWELPALPIYGNGQSPAAQIWITSIILYFDFWHFPSVVRILNAITDGGMVKGTGCRIGKKCTP